MIPVTPLRNRTVLLNVGKIERIEETPETVLVLTNGRRMVVVDLAHDVVQRIKRVHSLILASAAARTATASIRLHIVESDIDTIELTADAGADADLVSTTTLVHRGQICLDRILAAIARCQWIAREDLDGHILAQELGKAIEALDDLIDCLEPRTVDDVAHILAELLTACRDQLMMLGTIERDGAAMQGTVRVLRQMGSQLTKLRKVWARVGSDTASGVEPSL